MGTWHLGTARCAHLRAGNFEQAASRMREAIALGAGSKSGINRVGYAGLAMALHGLGKTSEAKEALAKAEAVERQPRVAWYLYSLGIAQYRSGQNEAAVQTLEKSLEVHPAWVGRSQNYVVLALACHRRL